MIGRVLCAALAVTAFCAFPAAAAPVSSDATAVTWHRDGVITWERTERRAIPAQTIHRFAATFAFGGSKIIAPGAPGVRQVQVRYAQRGGGPVHQTVLWSTVLRPPQKRIVADGTTDSALAVFNDRGFARMALDARGAIAMMATAYTASCAGCDGMTAIGRRAGRGIVAVDPRVIPLGTHLYISGYGPAIAGDTGGAIVGRRIDLGFNSVRDALLFGRRAVTVYRLK